jgi:hypothetical protein
MVKINIATFLKKNNPVIIIGTISFLIFVLRGAIDKNSILKREIVSK